MFNLNEIKELIQLVDETSVQEVEIENEGSRLVIRKPSKAETVYVQQATTAPAATSQVVQAPVNAPTTTSAPTTPEVDPSLHTIVSPMVGTFYRSSSPEAAPFVSTGDKVNDKSTVCIIEAMKLMNELEAETNGTIVEILAENGQLVEYGQPLFLVKPE
ncbi:acetyl-CoA carboxylase biotin carboxyl carrier protein [Paenibacillus sp. PK4536]|jgi:acetyl-CoA carboxylase biotin carboxyl carrier protein|uniref:Biotin carboxyl carrier protein of acetyl-CoA carboxylase n=1 Tax=Paenibacillus nuruki TaxID=1886670 RepID=A0A1E3L066_9BACL|nr:MULTISPECIES: acetyl-CoA carboxylase biotin carboxyl carrier protein [Paenibacillus]ODP27033.1 Biotin carboxyl carrier protein of acetyl-CoA carboxylase [Paenibacillus nuruki]TKJ94107.1 acetyl-CoA carboxylase biotin carboxyl carrier protein [Paenibacillus sp. CFBP13512]WIM38874.1 acetyl-CoA carboxylase biotin carboxyl carrier protein [Paenibacillus sp. PK4536]CAJ1314442.1 acetyl-CoA carboxylase biotin carboxyl carrier protein [Paenibacillus nuruki]